MELLAVGQHLDELSDLPRACFRLLHVLDPEENGVAIAAVERCEECFRLLVGIEGLLQVVGNRRCPRRGVRRIPSTILLGPFDFPHSGGMHSSRGDQRLGLRRVDLRPDAPGCPGREALQPVVFVLRLLLAVDPAVAERAFDRFRVGDGGLTGILLGQSKPDAGRRASVELEPGLPLGLVRKGERPITHGAFHEARQDSVAARGPARTQGQGRTYARASVLNSGRRILLSFTW